MAFVRFPALLLLASAAVHIVETSREAEENVENAHTNLHVDQEVTHAEAQDVHQVSNQTAASGTTLYPDGGMLLDTSKCLDLPEATVTKVSVWCEDILDALLHIQNHDEHGQFTAVHCGLMVQVAYTDDGGARQHIRRYDLGPATNTGEVNPLLIQIECSQGDDLHNCPANKYPCKDGHGGLEQSLLGSETEARTNPHTDKKITVGDVEDFIRNNQVTPNNYDLNGGNCQHFSVIMFEVLTDQFPCKSGLNPPNKGAINEVAGNFWSMMASPITGTLKGFDEVGGLLGIAKSGLGHDLDNYIKGSSDKLLNNASRQAAGKTWSVLRQQACP